MAVWLAMVGAFVLGVTAANAVSLRRYSRVHIVGHVALGGRGLFFSRTPDGTWLKLRLRARRCATTVPPDRGDAPPEGGVREPRRPSGPDPLGPSVEVQPPG